MIDSMLAMLMIAVACAGHAGMVVASYNRINATGLDRVTIKRIEKVILLFGLILPISLMGYEYRYGTGMIWPITFTSLTWPVWGYVLFCNAVVLLAAPFWIETRPRYAVAEHRFEVENSHTWKSRGSRSGMVCGESFQRMERLPKNEIGWTEVNVKRLRFRTLPSVLDGFTIGHLSDIHLTGEMHLDFYRRAIDWLMEQRPDILVVSGDIVDYAHALDQLPRVFETMHAAGGKFFVLGNHDRRLASPMDVVDGLTQLGWIDLGLDNHLIAEYRIKLIGNEMPWFHRHTQVKEMDPKLFDWTIGVAHSPDQFAWGEAVGCDLLLCGHTHGGQIRLPILGPLVAPSWYGSRYASGVFEREKTLMHVSRGLSGVHPFRWNCPPEVSLLRLQRDRLA